MIPNLTTTIKRNDGKRIQIRVRPRIKLYGEMVTYEYDVIISPPGKRKFVDVVDVDSYEYRSLSIQQKGVFTLQKQLEHVTPDEIYQAKLAAWEAMKPTL